MRMGGVYIAFMFSISTWTDRKVTRILNPSDIYTTNTYALKEALSWNSVDSIGHANANATRTLTQTHNRILTFRVHPATSLI